MSNAIEFSDYCTSTLVAAANNFQTTLLIGPVTDSLPTMSEAGSYFYLTIVDAPSYNIDLNPPAQREIVKVTAYVANATGYALTVVRGITTDAQVWAAGSYAEIRPCAQALYDLKDAGGGSASPLTTKGDVYGFSTVDARIPVGTNAQVLTADSTQALGVKWATPATGTSTTTSVTFIINTTWTVPAGVSGVFVSAIGAGGGGKGTASAASTSGGGGGAGEEGTNIPMPVTPGGTVSITIGAAGAGGAAGDNPGSDGGDTIVGIYRFLGGKGAAGASFGGDGGGVGSSAQVANSYGVLGIAESVKYFGGSSGGGPVVGNADGKAGGGSGGRKTGGAGGLKGGGKGGGGGGGATPFGNGGAGGAAESDGVSAAADAYGAGGGGAGSNTAAAKAGGAGCQGYAVIFYTA